MCWYIFFFAKLKERKRHFLEGARRESALWDYPQEHLTVKKDEKVCPIVKLEILLPLLCCLLNPLTNNHCSAWSSMIDLWTDSRTFQNYIIMMSARQRSTNYSKLSKENVLWNLMMSHWPSFAWRLFMGWFHKILKLVFQKQPSCPRNICTKHWRRPPIFTTSLEIFWYL